MKDHWEQVYATKDSRQCSWYQPRPEPSLDAIAQLQLPLDTPILDAGGGDMYLPDALLAQGYTDIRVVDISAQALANAKARLGEQAGQVTWIEADVRELSLHQTIGLWHDRAVFHFMTDPASQAQYREALIHALQPGGYAILATFAPEGPDRCSGLNVQQYSPEVLGDYFCPELFPVATWRQVHTKPDGGPQTFSWAIVQKLMPSPDELATD